MDDAMKTELKKARAEIDHLDSQLAPLLEQRMAVSDRVAGIKAKTRAPVYVPQREAEVIGQIKRLSRPEYKQSLAAVYAAIMAESRARQNRHTHGSMALRALERDAAPALEKRNITVACQGIEGAYSHAAAERMFPGNTFRFLQKWEDVFQAVEHNEVQYGILPVENSTAGSVIQVYELILKHRFYIVEALDLSIAHCLAAKPETQSVHTVVSHPQALRQCDAYIRAHGYQTAESLNTAAAAKLVQDSAEIGLAAICSLKAAEIHKLKVLKAGIQDEDRNVTRFIAVSKAPVLTKIADKISLCFSLENQVGSLCHVLQRFALQGLSLTKIESRPIAGSNFEYIFYLDFTGNIHDRDTLDLMCELEQELPGFSFLGNYKEIGETDECDI